MNSRWEKLKTWLAGIGDLNFSTIRAVSEDASFRRYYRLDSGNATRIIMDAPPEHEDCEAFIKIADYLAQMDLNSPSILAADLDQGFILLTDLGSKLYLTELRNDRSCVSKLYEDAISALVRMQKLGTEFQLKLPPYDESLLSFELSLFHDWFCKKHLAIKFTDSDEAQWQECCRLLIDNAMQQPKVFVHRDYHSRNLIMTDQNNPGILDFQDAVEGPLTYDLVSLLKDCYIRWPANQVRTWALQFYNQLGDELIDQLDADQFIRYFDLMGVQRHLKATGIFARLKYRDGKSGYMSDVPRTLEYIETLEPKYNELSYLMDLIIRRCLPILREKY